jgi:uncharacterized protein YfaQ (DUF2300 family)
VTDTSTPAGAITAGPAIIEHFISTVRFNSRPQQCRDRVPERSFSKAAITSDGAIAMAVFTPTTTFASDVITDPRQPRSLSVQPASF